MTLPPATLWIDPGKMTGLALYNRGERETIADERAFLAAAAAIEQTCGWWGRRLWVGWEHFYIGPKTPSADAHYAIEMIGVARMWALRFHCVILPHAAPGDRNVATQKMLEALGWWRPGKDDAQSAAQHLLAFMMRTGNLPPKETGILAALRHQGEDTCHSTRNNGTT